MLPFALFEAELGSAVHEGVRLVGCCHLRDGIGPSALPKARLAVTRTRRKSFHLRCACALGSR